MPSLYRIENNNQINNVRCENKGGKKAPPPKKKLSFKSCKKNTIKSLHEVEYFLNHFNHFIKYVKLYKILK